MNTIEQDIWTWITDFVEVNHKFYNYNFPPCPYARAARLKGEVSILVWQKGSMLKFVNQSIKTTTTKQTVLVFPWWMKWHWAFHWWIRYKNKTLAADNLYAQYGIAQQTKSQFSGIGHNKPYFIVIVNTLDDVVEGHLKLLNTDYYKNWDKSHYNNVVSRRNNIYQKHRNKQ